MILLYVCMPLWQALVLIPLLLSLISHPIFLPPPEDKREEKRKKETPLRKQARTGHFCADHRRSNGDSTQLNSI
ncbi:hypothetical protein HOY82DRAFT_56643 [Tuber indicum]|nr:hypothetical protein HOY82DRAFT_56643 [Tuber indicum]